MAPTLVYVSIALTALWAIAFRKRQHYRYPPGPKSLPIVGNILHVPTGHGWITFRDWARQYGSDLLHFHGLGMHIVVVNSAKAAKDLFEKRYINYSDKEVSTMMLQVAGPERNWIMMPYGDEWKEHRRLFHQHFRPGSVSQFHPKQSKAVRRLLNLLLDSRDDFLPHVRYMSGSLILDIIYAFDVQPDDSRLALVEKAMSAGEEIVKTGIFLVDIFPILMYLPAWFPGAGFKRKAAKWKALVDDMYEVPYGLFKTAVNEGGAQPCLTLSLLSEADTTDISKLEETFIALTGTAYSAGSDTTAITITTFVLAMILNPEIQAFVQEELDQVVGNDRLPVMEDQPSLPRVAAVMHEVMRRYPPMPLATPHRSTTDDEYNGYHIPAGSMVIGNTWAILHDEEVYPDPFSFNPKRFLSEDGKLRDDVPLPTETFGYGRRICAGRYFAMDALFLAISSLLAVFNIEKAVDENGKPIEVKVEFTPYVFSQPKPFKARFKPRNPGAESLIRSAALADA
ncbi:uncharacterized protein PHACADRAFT_256800 [Phanerochaete carnosa HHB-10118-sp]|uniref:Cytochrome P450 n=1 Tax=Phanerochaete carnosa (strain HHB-10118-sp) TaxID=650164 RepID=K5V097_PHACS|nr:uncharacterized protein PHACADRAFT_256800 [Phanerochaete carnosa HHB-10118-sp]EKM55876.1 hypothetical protein PHACADRAFT_256800 [Phanerochaete carnosa HHB-10118-sp]